MDSKDYFAVMVDIETTGLSAQDDVPLEVGVCLVDALGNKGPSAKWLCHDGTQEFEKVVEKGMKNEFVGPMHEKSGLWDDLAGVNLPFTLTRAELDDALCEWLTSNEVAYGTLPMMGNSIGSLDRPFFLVHFPDANKFLSYRNIDVSTIKEACKALNPDIWEKLKPTIGDKANATHRVMGDIDACIKEWQAYIDNFFFVTI